MLLKNNIRWRQDVVLVQAVPDAGVPDGAIHPLAARQDMANKGSIARSAISY